MRPLTCNRAPRGVIMVASLIGGSSGLLGGTGGRPTILVRPNQLAEHRSATETRSRRNVSHIGNGLLLAPPLLVGLVARLAGGEDGSSSGRCRGRWCARSAAGRAHPGAVTTHRPGCGRAVADRATAQHGSRRDPVVRPARARNPRGRRTYLTRG